MLRSFSLFAATTALMMASAAVLPRPGDGSSGGQSAGSFEEYPTEGENATRVDYWPVDILNVSQRNTGARTGPMAEATRLRHSPGCRFSTCIVTDLGNRLQTGDEAAGDSASSSLGNGKK